MIGFINSLISIRTVYLIVFVVAVLMLIQYMSSQSADVPQTRRTQARDEGGDGSAAESESHRGYQPGDKED